MQVWSALVIFVIGFAIAAGFAVIAVRANEEAERRRKQR